MPQLKSFCLDYLNWSSLKELQVTHCEKLNMLNIATSKNESAKRETIMKTFQTKVRSSLERERADGQLL